MSGVTYEQYESLLIQLRGLFVIDDCGYGYGYLPCKDGKTFLSLAYIQIGLEITIYRYTLKKEAGIYYYESIVKLEEIWDLLTEESQKVLMFNLDLF